MIAHIKNKHLRRMALILATPVVMFLAPFSAIATEVPKIMREWHEVFGQAWRQP